MGPAGCSFRTRVRLGGVPYRGHPYSAVKERILATGLIAGVVVVTPRHGDEKSLLDLGKEVSLVVLDHRASGSSFPHVTVDNLRAGHEATRYLIQKGRRRIAMITGPMDIQSARERLSGYRLALEEANFCPTTRELVRQGWFIHSSGYEQTQALLNRGKPYPDAIFCSNDLMAAGALQALKEAGLRVPEDVAVMGFDDLEMARTTQPPLTTMAQPIQTMGETAIRLLSRLIKGEEPDVRRVVLEAKLVVRQSA